MESKLVDIIAHTSKLPRECKQNGDTVGKQATPSIYIVPSLVRDLSPTSFSPRVVAIGPLHRQDEHLQEYEVQKTIYLHNMLLRLGTVPEQALRTCAEKVIHSIERIKACYARSVSYSDSELAKMMVIDSFFILEFISSLSNSSSETNLLITPNILITRSIIHDLLLIENQIPFFVLQNIFECTILVSEKGASLTKHIEELVKYYYLFLGNRVVPRASTPEHILGFVHKYYQPVEPMPPVSLLSCKGYSAMELGRAGVKFKPNDEDPNWAMAMKLESTSWFPNFTTIPRFSWYRRPTLRMPKVRIGDYSELILRNLIMYEHTPGVTKYVTSFACAMDMLIDTGEDVALLKKSKVLASYFGSNEDAANMINKLSKNFTCPEFFYDQEWKHMDAYYNSYWPHTFAGLKRTYFNNPWSVIALLAAFVLFTLTITQTIFTIKAA
ncbi:unnamed protein product [Lactuca saligna]|uniref:Uncharacterized protein n=1 Tax=Lactuca saligna TaxID=75948 RepID=A0AA35YKH0_LACSI|nr:unnamed protein product [Lactuca saligna]